MPDRDRAADVEAADAALARKVSGLEVALALDRRGFADIARAIVEMQRQRVSADYLQTSAVIDAEGVVHSAVNDPNLYTGPGHGIPPGGREVGGPAGASARARLRIARRRGER